MPGPGAERRSWWLGGVLVAAVVILLGAGQAWAVLTAQSSSLPTQYDGPVTALDLDLANASAKITAGPADQATVRQNLDWTLRRPQVAVSQVGQTLRVKARCPEILGIGEPSCSVALDISVPPTTAVTLRMTSGSSRIVGLSGDLSLRSTSGEIELEKDSGRIAARSTSGRIGGLNLTSPEVQAVLTSGEVDLRFLQPPGHLVLGVTSGSVSVALPPGSTYQVATRTGAGGADVDPALEDPTSPRTISVTTTSGHAGLGYGGSG